MHTTKKSGGPVFIAYLLLLALPVCGWAQFTFSTNNEAITITSYTGSGGNVIIPSIINGYPVTTIGDYAFWEPMPFNDSNRITEVTIPNGVTSIGDDTFYQCYGLTNVVIGTNLTSIGPGAFNECQSLTSLTIPNSVTNIGDGAFINCYLLANVTIPNGVRSIGFRTFYGCYVLTNVMIPNSVTNIGEQAFYNCKSLTSVTIPNSVTSIGRWAFEMYAPAGLSNAVFFLGNAPLVNGGAGSDDDTVFSQSGQGYSGTNYYVPGTTGWSSTFGGWPTAQWYQPQPQILGSNYGLGVQSNRFQFTISWATNTSVVVETSTNFQNWTPLITNALVNGTNFFSDSASTNSPQQFYRVRSQ